MTKVELKVLSILDRIPSFPGLFILLLQEKEGERKLPVVIGLPEAQSIAAKMRGVTFARPFTHDLFVSLFAQFDLTLTQVLIYQADGGTYRAFLLIEDAQGEVRQIDARTSDAIALAMRSEAPIYIFDTLLEDYCLRDAESVKSVVVPLEEIDTDKLKSALKEAIEEERYEWAGRLSRELKRRGE